MLNQTWHWTSESRYYCENQWTVEQAQTFVSLPHPISSTACSLLPFVNSNHHLVAYNSRLANYIRIAVEHNPKKISVDEKFNKSLVKELFAILFEWWCRKFSPNFIFCWQQKKIFNQDHISSVVQMTVNNSGSWKRQHMSHRNFWNLSMKVGGAATWKSQPIPQFVDFHSI